MRALAACLLTLLPLAHGESGPSDAAVSFLIDVARERIDLSEDTAMAEGTTREKQRFIRQSLRNLSRSVDQGELKAIDERIEGGLAGVLVSRMIDYDPGQLEVHAVALLKRDGKWLAAPMPSSFENTGITYIPDLSENAKELEIWMLQQRRTHLNRLRTNIQDGLLEDVRKSMSVEELRGIKPEELVERFINACRERDLPALLACLGGLEEPKPDDWEDTLRFAAGSIRTADAPTEAWRRLVSNSSARAVVLKDLHNQGATISIGEFSPVESTPGDPQIAILHFPLDLSKDQLWRIRLPSWLLDGAPPVDPDRVDRDLVEEFPAKLLENHPPRHFEDPNALAHSLQKALAGEDFEAVLHHLADAGEDDTFELLERAADLWREFRGHRSQSPLLLDLHRDDEQACILIARFDSRSPRIRRSQIESVFLKKTGKGWSIPAEEPEASIAANPTLANWSDQLVEQTTAEWLDHLDIVTSLGGIPADSAPGEKEARATAEAWLNAVNARDPRAILRTVAYFDDEQGVEKLLRTVGHELQSERGAEILGIHTKGRWAAVSTRTLSANRSDPPNHLLYPIVATPLGPRVLAEAALFHADTRSREFLNSAIWNRLSARLPDAAVAELKEIQAAHDRLVEESPAE